MKSPPKMPQRAMVRIWVVSLHQKTSTYESTLRFLFCDKAKLVGRVDSNSIGPPNSPAGKKSPCGAFLDARLATSTRAHQKNQRRNYAGSCFARHLKSHSRGWIRTASAPFSRTISSSARISRTIRTVVTIVYCAS